MFKQIERWFETVFMTISVVVWLCVLFLTIPYDGWFDSMAYGQVSHLYPTFYE